MVNPRLCEDLRLLVVEDQPHMNELVGTVVASLGAKAVTRVTNGHEALAAIAADPPDILITDLCMAGLDGLELVRNIRAMPQPARSVHVIMVTGQRSEESARAADEAGVDVFITKPIWTKRLFSALESYVAGW